MSKYDYAGVEDVVEASSIEEAIRITAIKYFHNQLGWPREKCEQRVEKEINLEIPIGLFENVRRKRDWQLAGARLVDVGAGQGGAVLEALHRDADAHGIEPGPEFAALAKRRLEADEYSADRIHQTGGADLPFEDDSFDYAISLQVLEHVEDPRPLLEEMYRVLKPGGEAVVRCENYLAFWEQHYRVPWLPLLPKPIGSLYLRAIGRDPSFLNNYVFYSTYPQIWRLASEVGFENTTYSPRLEKARTLDGFKTRSSALAGKLLRLLPANIRVALARWVTHVQNAFSVGIGLNLRKSRRSA